MYFSKCIFWIRGILLKLFHYISHSALVPSDSVLYMLSYIYVKLIRYQLWCTKCTFRQTTNYWQDCKELVGGGKQVARHGSKFFEGLNVLVNFKYIQFLLQSAILKSSRFPYVSNLCMRKSYYYRSPWRNSFSLSLSLSYKSNSSLFIVFNVTVQWFRLNFAASNLELTVCRIMVEKYSTAQEIFESIDNFQWISCIR
jgi:hypothetical protein